MYSIGSFVVSGVFIKALTPGFCDYMGGSDIFLGKTNVLIAQMAERKI